MTTTPPDTDASAVLTRVAEALRRVLDDCPPDPGTVTMETLFVEDLDLESIDLVTLTGELRTHYGEHVDFPAYFASLDIGEIAGLTVGHLVHHIVDRLG
ncbi:acyl carrier protein [Streptomyces sp. AV19]|uniref:acyl carrier protein n=1 Tax=Streptomyces sp. AV19 TaxID=2793068 RepID=UPI0018FEAB93|nr:acyl carrier protein [Streptomyces sp. AV19]MBH1932964.1 acyl carrier protein [Streptomyces sp. AV19]MDG4533865.1 acyl carrier protein [Streptomyces sp. AV19]